MTEKRTLDEILARYSLEPDLRDLYVEGDSDVRRLRWMLSKLGLYDAKVYPISDIEIEEQRLTDRGLPNGRRSQVIELALFLCESGLEDQGQVTALADLDLGIEPSGVEQCTFLLFTEHCSIETYAWSASSLEKFLDLVAFYRRKTADELMGILEAPLTTFFAVRVARKSLGIDLQHLPIEHECSIHSDLIVFDLESYVRKYINRGPKGNKEDLFNALLGASRTIEYSLLIPVGQRIYGHDFCALLSWYLLKTGGDRDVCNLLSVERTLFACVDLDEFRATELGKTLQQRLSR